MRRFACSTTTVSLTLIIRRNVSFPPFAKTKASNQQKKKKEKKKKEKKRKRKKKKRKKKRKKEELEREKKKKSFLRSGDPNGMRRVLRRGLAFFPFPSDLSKWKNHAEVILSIRSSWAVMESSLAPVT